MTAALEVRDLTHRFGPRTALNNVNFAVAQGAFTVLLGPNGAGKTTLFALITRLYHAHRGHITVFGQDFRSNPSAALARMGVVFQQSTLDLDLTIAQNMEYHAALHGIASRVARPRIVRELERVGLADRQHERVRLLSGGQRRRVELARALLHEPALLLLDEPTAGLDLESRRFLLEHVRHLCRTRGLAVLWATHLIEEAALDANVVVLHRGCVLAAGSVADVVAHEHASGLQDAFESLIRVAA